MQAVPPPADVARGRHHVRTCVDVNEQNARGPEGSTKQAKPSLLLTDSLHTAPDQPTMQRRTLAAEEGKGLQVRPGEGWKSRCSLKII